MLVQGLQQGLVQGLRQGLNPTDSRLLLDARFHTPNVQLLPATQEGLAAALGGTKPLASALYRGPAVSGVLADRVGSLDLSAVGSPLDSQKGVGLGSPPPGVVECPAGSRYESAFPSPPGSDPFAMVHIFRAHQVPSSTSRLAGLNGTHRAQLRITGAGLLQLLAIGATTTVAVNAGDAADGAWVCAVIFVDPASGLNLWSDRGDASSTTAPGAISDTSLFVGSIDALRLHPGLTALFLADEAAKVGSDGANMLDRFWTRFNDPSGRLSVYARASLYSDVVGSDVSGDLVNHFSGEPSPPQVAWGHRGFSLGQGYGLSCYDGPITNELTHSEDLTEWTDSDTTVTANDGDSPDGFRSMDLVTQTDTDGEERILVSGLDAEEDYTASVWGNSDGQGAKTGRITVYEDDSGSPGAVIATDTISLTNANERHSVAFSTPAGVTAVHVGLRPEDGASDGRAHFWGAQVNLGSLAPYVRTAGASASTVRIDPRFSDKVPAKRGEVELVFRLDQLPDDSVTFLLDARTGGINNLRRVQVTPAGTLGVVTADSSGSISSNYSPGTVEVGTEYRFRYAWDSSGGILGEYTSWARLEGETPVASANALSADDADMEMFVGRTLGSANVSRRGSSIARVKVYSEFQGENA